MNSSDTTALAAASTADRDAQLAELFGAEGLNDTVSWPETTQIAPDDDLPLSFAQELLWLVDRMHPDDIAYNVRWAMRIRGRLNVTALEAALNTIVSRHAVLRTTYHDIEGRPVQKIAVNHTVHLNRESWRGIPLAERAPAIDDWLARDARRSFSLSRDTLHGTVIQLADDDWVLVLALHHIMCDGWSRSIFFSELAQTYRAAVAGTVPTLPKLPLTYADYAQIQRNTLTGQTLADLLTFWKRQLQGAPDLIGLPTDRPRQATQSPAGARQQRLLKPELIARLKQFSTQNRCTLFMTMLAAYYVLLHRWTGQEDFVVGAPVANRNQLDAENLIGLFVNVLPLRVRLRSGMTFLELLRETQQAALNAFDHQDLPFEKLIVELHPARSLSYSPIFQVMFILQNMPQDVRQLGDLKVETLPTPHTATKFDLTLSLLETQLGMTATVGYRTALFDAGTIARFLGHYERLLESIVADPDSSLQNLPMLQTDERRQLIEQWEPAADPDPAMPYLHELIADQALRRPAAIAVVGGKTRWTYRELDQRACRMANLLRQRGVGPGRIIGICLDRCPDMIVAVLAVLKSGAAYLALDPEYPQERLDYMIQEANLHLVITRESRRSSLPARSTNLVLVDADSSLIESQPVDMPPQPRLPGQAAYVVFTSGTTGRSKGVLVSHAAFANAYAAWESAYELQPGDVHLQMASFSFDVFSGDFARALASGARLVLCPREIMLSPRKLLDLMRTERVNCAEFVPAVLRELAQYLQHSSQRLDFMRLLIAGSDVWRTDEFRQVKLLCGDGTRVINSYGIAEATIDSTYFEGDPQGIADDGPVPIGRPFKNTEIYILDSRFEPVACGIAGELYVGGNGLAHGYLNAAGQTAAKFVPHPFSRTPGSRLYRTGDIARYRSDGTIEFLGRADHQLKIRGFRIEPGEIEAALVQNPGVKEALVIVREDQPDQRRLVAYVVPDATASPQVEELRQSLEQKLPTYMIPSAIVCLAAFPRTPNGKLDRQALPAPEAMADPSNERILVPRDVWEAQLLNIWRRTLKNPDIALDDNFFELGGHSLLAAKMLSEIHVAFGIELPLICLFQSPTIHRLARLLLERAHDREWPTLVPIQPSGSATPIFFVAKPNVNALGYAMLAPHLAPDRPIYVLQSQFRTEDSGPYTLDEYEQLAAEYVKAIQSVQPQGPYLLAGMCEGAHSAFEIARLLQRQKQGVAFLGFFDTWAVENTRNYFLWYSNQVLKSLRQKQQALWHRGRRAVAAALRLLNLRTPSESTTDSAPVLSSNIADKDSWKNRYFPGKDFVPTKFEGTITVFRVADQPFYRIKDRSLGWNARATGGAEIIYVPGIHSKILREPHVADLAALLEDRIQRVCAPSQRVDHADRRQ